MAGSLCPRSARSLFGGLRRHPTFSKKYPTIIVYFFSKREPTCTKPEVLNEKLKTVLPNVILKFFCWPQIHQIFKPIRLFFRNDGMTSQAYINMIFNFNFYVIKKVHKNFVMGLKIWWGWGSELFFSKTLQVGRFLIFHVKLQVLQWFFLFLSK